MSPQIAKPRAVLPDPGGPVISTPLGGFMCNCSNIFKCCKGKWIYDFNY